MPAMPSANVVAAFITKAAAAHVTDGTRHNRLHCLHFISGSMDCHHISVPIEGHGEVAVQRSTSRRSSVWPVPTMQNRRPCPQDARRVLDLKKGVTPLPVLFVPSAGNAFIQLLRIHHGGK